MSNNSQKSNSSLSSEREYSPSNSNSSPQNFGTPQANFSSLVKKRKTIANPTEVKKSKNTTKKPRVRHNKKQQITILIPSEIQQRSILRKKISNPTESIKEESNSEITSDSELVVSSESTNYSERKFEQHKDKRTTIVELQNIKSQFCENYSKLGKNQRGTRVNRKIAEDIVENFLNNEKVIQILRSYKHAEKKKTLLDEKLLIKQFLVEFDNFLDKFAVQKRPQQKLEEGLSNAKRDTKMVKTYKNAVLGYLRLLMQEEKKEESSASEAIKKNSSETEIDRNLLVTKEVAQKNTQAIDLILKKLEDLEVHKETGELDLMPRKEREEEEEDEGISIPEFDEENPFAKLGELAKNSDSSILRHFKGTIAGVASGYTVGITFANLINGTETLDEDSTSGGEVSAVYYYIPYICAALGGVLGLIYDIITLLKVKKAEKEKKATLHDLMYGKAGREIRRERIARADLRNLMKE